MFFGATSTNPIFLILYGLNPYCNGRCSLGQGKYTFIGESIGVLILIVMEDVLWGDMKWPVFQLAICLNPYCNGRCSLGRKSSHGNAELIRVLILIVMEDVLWV